MNDLILRVSSPGYPFNNDRNEYIRRHLEKAMFAYHSDHEFVVDVVVGDIIQPINHPEGRPE